KVNEPPGPASSRAPGSTRTAPSTPEFADSVTELATGCPGSGNWGLATANRLALDGARLIAGESWTKATCGTNVAVPATSTVSYAPKVNLLKPDCPRSTSSCTGAGAPATGPVVGAEPPR